MKHLAFNKYIKLYQSPSRQPLHKLVHLLLEILPQPLYLLLVILSLSLKLHDDRVKL